MHTKPLPYQREGAAAIERFGGRALLADQMGLGKTFQTLLWARRNPEVRPIVVVCPASVKYVWEREASSHFGMISDILEGTRPPKEGLLHHAPILIINYDILKPWLKVLAKIKPQLVIVDESHYIANRKAKRSLNVRALCKNVPHVICTSGTPLTNRPAELWPTLNLLKPALFPAFRPFADEYCKPTIAPWGWEYNGAKNLPQLHTLLKETVMIRRRKKDVLDQLPDKLRFVVPMPIARRKEYLFAVEHFMSWLTQTGGAARARRAKKAMQMAKLGYLKRLVGELKYGSVKDWVSNFLEEDEGKLVVFTVHKQMVHLLRSDFHDICSVVDGSVIGRERQRAVDRFSRKKDIRLFIGNLRAAGTGLNGLQVASSLAFAEMGWTPGEHAQGEDRIHRIGQHGQASCYYLVAANTIEEKLCKLIQKKQRIVDETIDGLPGVEGMDIFDELVLEMEREEKLLRKGK